MMKIHHTLTPSVIESAVQRAAISLDNPGFCIACGAGVDGVEPDACEYECECCGEPGVYGAAELLLCGGVPDPDHMRDDRHERRRDDQ